MHKHQLISRKLNSNAAQIHTLEPVYHEIATRMVERLDYIKVNGNHVLDIGSGLNVDVKLLAAKLPKANIYKVDIALEILKQYRRIPSHKLWTNKLWRKNQDLICADALKLPIKSQSMNLVWSNLVLPYIHDIKSYFKEIRRVLTLGGTFLVSGLGVDSLYQLRDLGLTTYDFPDMHLIGDILIELGFSDPVTDVEYIKLEYDSLNQLLNEVRLIGCGAANLSNYPRKEQSSNILPVSSVSQRVESNYLTKDRYFDLKRNLKPDSNGKFSLTLEVFYAHAWKDKVVVDLAPNQSIVQFKPRL
jgi:malonyl-CoA O-methyltransferase